MEAHQKLPGPVAVTCCRGVTVEAASRDDSMIVLELMLGEGPRRFVLDQMPLLGTRVFFPFTKDMPLTRFDEIGVVVHRLPRPTGQSPKVAIQRFVLVH
jgi:hypothetical protein